MRGWWEFVYQVLVLLEEIEWTLNRLKHFQHGIALALALANCEGGFEREESRREAIEVHHSHGEHLLHLTKLIAILEDLFRANI